MACAVSSTIATCAGSASRSAGDVDPAHVHGYDGAGARRELAHQRLGSDVQRLRVDVAEHGTRADIERRVPGPALLGARTDDFLIRRMWSAISDRNSADVRELTVAA
jgi:hypothetical protein